MGIAALIAFANGTVMAPADVQTNFSRVGTDWLNGDVDNTDLGASTVNHQHLYKRDFHGFPLDGSSGCFGDLFAHISPRDAQDMHEQHRRADLHAAILHASNRTPIPGLGWTGFLKKDALVEISMWAELFEFHHSAAPVQEQAGRLECWLHDKANASYTEFTPGRLRLATDPDHASGYLVTTRRLNGYGFYVIGASGIYDIFWAWNTTGAASSTRQLVAGHRGILVEHHHT